MKNILIYYFINYIKNFFILSILASLVLGCSLAEFYSEEPSGNIGNEINKLQNTVTTDGEKTKIRVEGRHDPCVSPRAVPIAEAMVALTLIDHLMRNQFSKLK